MVNMARDAEGGLLRDDGELLGGLETILVRMGRSENYSGENGEVWVGCEGDEFVSKGPLTTNNEINKKNKASR